MDGFRSLPLDVKRIIFAFNRKRAVLHRWQRAVWRQKYWAVSMELRWRFEDAMHLYSLLHHCECLWPSHAESYRDLINIVLMDCWVNN